MQGDRAQELVGPDVWRICRELIPVGSVFAFLAEHREVLFPAEFFADMYPSPNGRPSLPPQVLAAVVVLQSLQGVSDFEAVQQLRCDLRWKAACGLGLHDTGFDPSLLTYFRRRLARSPAPRRIFTTIGEVVAATGVLDGKTRRVLDSTVLDDAVATHDTVTQIVAAIRRVIREVPDADEVAAAWCTAHDYTDPGKPKIAWNDAAARAQLVDALVTDALNLLGRLPEQPLDARAADAVGLLALVAGQDVEPATGSDGRDGRWRIAPRTIPDRMVSTVDPEARHIHKNRTRHQDGFKAHVDFEPEVGLFTAVAVTSGYGPDNSEAAVAVDLLAAENPGAVGGPELTVLGDCAYGTGELRAHLTGQGHTMVIKPPPLRRAVPGGFTIDDFEVGTDTVTCPAGHTTKLGRPQTNGNRTAQFKQVCANCPLRQRCTTAKTGRTINVHPHHELLTAARVQAATDTAWQDEYRRWQPPVERAIAWLVTHGHRRVRYRGVIANDLALHHRAAALNLRRLINLGLTATNGSWHLTPATP
ncbi:IS1182 family transposase [Nocardia sp. SYP-A9097]|uniref:IS1182 family transposase n=1 Tax=Nocardia sp. SYP-A9097 TaxID=2663237 RepID=UPI00129B5AFC|nr:IS1182 family transposase [Nocardia sp. SYP-A9097]MRH93427.1 IS1182 family transposase [Nocardia sp. SYP-A9097]